MAMMRRKFIPLAIVALFVLGGGCKKYDEGPLISLRTKKQRVSNVWKIDEQYVNGVVQELVDSLNTDTYEFTTDNVFKLTSDSVTYEGSWEFNHDKAKVVISYGEDLEVRTIPWYILKLKEKEFWFTYQENGSTIEEHLVPN